MILFAALYEDSDEDDCKFYKKICYNFEALANYFFVN